MKNNSLFSLSAPLSRMQRMTWIVYLYGICLILLHDGPKRCEIEAERKRAKICTGSSKYSTANGKNKMKRSNARLEYVILWEQEKTELNCPFEQPGACKRKTTTAAATMIHFCMPHGGRQWINEAKQKKRIINRAIFQCTVTIAMVNDANLSGNTINSDWMQIPRLYTQNNECTIFSQSIHRTALPYHKIFMLSVWFVCSFVCRTNKCASFASRRPTHRLQ